MFFGVKARTGMLKLSLHEYYADVGLNESVHISDKRTNRLHATTRNWTGQCWTQRWARRNPALQMRTSQSPLKVGMIPSEVRYSVSYGQITSSLLCDNIRLPVPDNITSKGDKGDDTAK